MQPADEELIVRSLAGVDQRAYGELVQRYQSPVRGWLRQLTGDPALADDIAQDTFIRGWHKLASYSGKGAFKAWIMRIAYNEFLQTLRRLKRHRQPGQPASPVPEPVSDAGDFDGEFTDVPRFLSVVSKDERMALLLVHGYGLSHTEASEVTGLPLGTVKSHLRRGKEKIRNRFELSGDGGLATG